MSFANAFDQVRIINLPKRADRRREMDRELQQLGISGDQRIQYFPARRPLDAGKFTSIGARGCYESHKDILREAARLDQSVLILEDDCEFATNARTYELPDNWDIFYGGIPRPHQMTCKTATSLDPILWAFQSMAQKLSARS